MPCFILFFKFGLICTTFFFFFAPFKSGGMTRSDSRNSINDDLRSRPSGGGLSIASMGTGRHSAKRAQTPSSRRGSSVYIGGDQDSGLYYYFHFCFGLFSSFFGFCSFLAPFSYVVTWRKSSSHWTRVSGMGLPADAHSASQTFQCVHGVHVRRYFDDTNVASLH